VSWRSIDALTDDRRAPHRRLSRDHYTYESGREGDMPLTGFSPRKAATVLYGMTGFSDSGAMLANL